MTTLTTKTVIVTGGATGIGLATVRRVLAEGGNVVVASRDPSRRGEVEAELGTDRLLFHQTDVTDESAVISLVQATVDRFGRLDHLFNNAGVEGTVGPMAAWSSDQVDDVFAVNVRGAFLCMKHAAPVMAAGSVIVNASSVLATIPIPVAAPYGASKAALLSLTRSVAAELEERDVAVYAICPGVVDTPMMDRVSAAAGAPKEALAKSICPSGRVMSADGVADVVIGLLSRSFDLGSGSAVRVGPGGIDPITMELTRELHTV
jgi:NAD(P)-dependent dehydrogenase (short-subunit alcohol dehydrogenase family)